MLMRTNSHYLKSSSFILSKPVHSGKLDFRPLQTQGDFNVDEESKLPLRHPSKGVLVYTGRMAQYVKAVKTLSLSTSMLALLAQPAVIAAAKDDLMFKAGLMGSISAVIVSTPALVHFVTKKYVTDVYFNEDTKVFTLAHRSFFLRRKELQYTAGDVVLPFAPRMFVSHIVKGRGFFIELEAFRDTEIYKHMVGFDKPMDFTSGRQTGKPKMEKKFGLFENDNNTQNQLAEKTPAHELKAKQMDDDEDDNVAYVVEFLAKEKQKHKNKM